MNMTRLLVLLSACALILGFSIQDTQLTIDIWTYLIPALVLATIYEQILEPKIRKEEGDNDK